MKSFYSTIICQFDINNYEANNKQEYIDILKEQFYLNHQIVLRDYEITNIQEEEN